MPYPDYIVHQIAGVLRVADLVEYRRAPAPRVSLKTPVAVRYLADLTDTRGGVTGAVPHRKRGIQHAV